MDKRNDGSGQLWKGFKTIVREGGAHSMNAQVWGFSVNIKDSHWCDFLLSIPDRYLYYLDSSFSFTGDAVHAKTAALLELLNRIDDGHKKNWSLGNIERECLNQQDNQYDCGVYGSAYVVVSSVIFSKHPSDIRYLLEAMKLSITANLIPKWRLLLHDAVSKGRMTQQLLDMVVVPVDLKSFSAEARVSRANIAAKFWGKACSPFPDDDYLSSRTPLASSFPAATRVEVLYFSDPPPASAFLTSSLLTRIELLALNQARLLRRLDKLEKRCGFCKKRGHPSNKCIRRFRGLKRRRSRRDE
jgi:hypothetical protein